MKRTQAFTEDKLAISLFILIGFPNLAWSSVCSERKADAPTNCGVIIVDSTLGGVAAALEAATLFRKQKSNLKVCMTSPTTWVGGQMTVEGVPPLDEPNGIRIRQEKPKTEIGGHCPSDARKATELIMNESVASLAAVLTRNGISRNPTSHPPKAGTNWVSRWDFSAEQGNDALQKALSEFTEGDHATLEIFCNSLPIQVDTSKDGKSITSIQIVQRTPREGHKAGFLSDEIADWYSSEPSSHYDKRSFSLGSSKTSKSPIFLDASESGDIISMSHAKSTLGLDPGAAFDSENPAGCQMAGVFPSILEKKEKTPTTQAESERAFVALEKLVTEREKEVKSREHLSDEQLKTLESTLTKSFSFEGRSPEAVFTYRQADTSPAITYMNWGPGNDYPNLPLLDPNRGYDRTALEQAELRSLLWAVHYLRQANEKDKGFVYLYKRDAEKEIASNTGLSPLPYIRESRHILGYDPGSSKREFTLRIKDIVPASHNPLARGATQYPDSIGYGSYGFDVRACSKDLKLDGLIDDAKLTGHFPVDGSSGLFQIPLRSMVTATVSNLGTANTKTMAVDRNANAATRLHPAEWSAGFGMGVASAWAAIKQQNLHQIVEKPKFFSTIQNSIKDQGGKFDWFNGDLKSCEQEGEGSYCCPVGLDPSEACPSGKVNVRFDSCSTSRSGIQIASECKLKNYPHFPASKWTCEHVEERCVSAGPTVNGKEQFCCSKGLSSGACARDGFHPEPMSINRAVCEIKLPRGLREAKLELGDEVVCEVDESTKKSPAKQESDPLK